MPRVLYRSIGSVEAGQRNTAGPFMQENSIDVQQNGTVIVPLDGVVIPNLVKQGAVHGYIVLMERVHGAHPSLTAKNRAPVAPNWRLPTIETASR